MQSTVQVRAAATDLASEDRVVPATDPYEVYATAMGRQFCGDSRRLLATLRPASVDLIVTSPPFALLREKSYGNEAQAEYVAWLAEFGALAKRVLKETGSIVLDIGGAYQRGRPVRSLYNYRVLIEFCDTLGYELAEEFFWFNPSKLPSPIEWVNKRKIRVKDAVNPVWWFSKSDYPKADVRRVRVEYSKRMRELLDDPASFYKPAVRPSAHHVGNGFATDNGGAIPSNLLAFPNTDSTGHYLRTCRLLGQRPHPARFPSDLPRFFIRFLTEPDDTILDIFSGSNTTGRVAEEEGRKWLSCEHDPLFARLSGVRFMDGWDAEDVRAAWNVLEAGTAVDFTKWGGTRSALEPAIVAAQSAS